MIDEDTENISHSRYQMEDLRGQLQQAELDTHENSKEYQEI